MFEQDYIMRMIHDLVRMLAKLLLGKDTVMYEFPRQIYFSHSLQHRIGKRGQGIQDYRDPKTAQQAGRQIQRGFLGKQKLNDGAGQHRHPHGGGNSDQHGDADRAADLRVGLLRIPQGISPAVYFFGSKEELGHAMGKEMRASLALLDAGFAKAVEKELVNTNAAKTGGSKYGEIESI